MTSQQIDRIHDVSPVRRESQSMGRTVHDVQPPPVRLKLDQHPLTVQRPVVRHGVVPDGVPSGTHRRLDLQCPGRVDGVLVDENHAHEFLVDDRLSHPVEARSGTDVDCGHVVQVQRLGDAVGQRSVSALPASVGLIGVDAAYESVARHGIVEVRMLNGRPAAVGQHVCERPEHPERNAHRRHCTRHRLFSYPIIQQQARRHGKCN